MVTLVNLDPRLNDARIEPSEDFCLLSLRDEEHEKHIETSLKPIYDKLVSQILIDNVDLFAWIASDSKSRCHYTPSFSLQRSKTDRVEEKRNG